MPILLKKNSSIHPIFSEKYESFIVDMEEERERERCDEIANGHEIEIQTTFEPAILQSKDNCKPNMNMYMNANNDNGYGLKSMYSSTSQLSLSAEIVEAVMYDGRIGLTGSRGFEAAMWCGLGSFFIIGVALVITGLILTFF